MPRLSRVGPLWLLVLLSLHPTGGLFSCSTREKEVRGARVLVPKAWSLIPFISGRQSREALGTFLGSWHGVDLSGSPCLKATSGQSIEGRQEKGLQEGLEQRRGGSVGPSASACGTGRPAVS